MGYLAIKDNFLSEKECDFLIKYLKKQKVNFDSSTSYRYFRVMDIPFYHVRVSFLWSKILRRISEQFPNLRLSHGQIVEWTPGTFKKPHVDVDIPPKNSVGTGIIDWTTVCYLNENFLGGETLVDKRYIEPKKGRVVAFNSKILPHGVNMVDRDSRYTLIIWWSEMKPFYGNER